MYEHTIYYIRDGWVKFTTADGTLNISNYGGCAYIQTEDSNTGEGLLIPMTAVKYIHTVPVKER